MVKKMPYNFADICSIVCKFLINYLPFCVRTGAPEVRDPAIDKVLATVDIFLFVNKRENSETSEKKIEKILCVVCQHQTNVHSK